MTRIVFVLRQSPDWAALAADHARGAAVAPARYVPDHAVPSFPDHIAACIAAWNAQFAVDFFACRAELTRIAGATLDAVAGSVILPMADLPGALPAAGYRLCFLDDDDDWYAPDAAARMECAGDEDVAVFPLLRLDVPVFTFARQRDAASPLLGRVSEFSNRYQTNNYALHPRLCMPDLLPHLADHFDASATAERLGLRDAYHDVMVSVTNKSPVAASVVARIVQDPVAFRAHVAAFVMALRGLDVPPQAGWMAAPIAGTAELFERALG